MCNHPPARLFAYTAYDGAMVVGCCDCGAILKGGAVDAMSEACPGCGAMPGCGTTPSCKHPEGCGFWRAFEEA